MAYSKIKPIHSRLYKCVDYIVDPEKTALSFAIDYIGNENKTEQCLYVSTYNCSRDATAAEMQETRKRWGKADRKNSIQGYHLIISYLPGEVTAEQAHTYGRELVQKLLAGKYEVVLSTHTDKEHIHNHIVFNSVSWVDGKMYRNNFKDYFGDIRGVSDSICQEKQLSVIEPKSKGKQYAEWQAEKEKRPTIRSMIRKDIDEVIEQSFTYKDFLNGMRNRGYYIKGGPNIKHTAVKLKGSERFFRLSSLGGGYTEEAIKERLQRKRLLGGYQKKRRRYGRRKGRLRGSFHKSRRVTGIRALYWRYLYLLGKTKRKNISTKVSPYLYEDVTKFERYVKQNKFLMENKIETTKDLINTRSFFVAEIDRLLSERKQISKEVREKNGSISEDVAYQQCNEELKLLRSKLRQCDSIIETEGRIRAKVKTAEKMIWEEVQHEPRGRSSRTNDKGDSGNQRRIHKADGGRS